MPGDYKSWQRATWGIRDWHALEETVEHFWWWSTTPLSPGSELLIDRITVPSGMKFHYIESYASTEFDGANWLYIPSLGAKSIVFVSKNIPYIGTFDIPMIFPSGFVGEVWIRNDDIISGHWDIEGSVYKFPASEPEKPKNDDPEERYRVRDFNYLSSTILPNGDHLKIFSKIKEKKRNFLVIRDFGTENQKVITKGYLKPEDVDNVTKILREKPEMALEVVEKLRKRYKII